MFGNYVRVATAAPEIRVADTAFNASALVAAAKRAADEGVQILVLPELMLTGSTAADLFLFDSLEIAAEKAVAEVLCQTAEMPVVLVTSVPLQWRGRLYNAAVVMQNGRILGAVPKMILGNYGENYELRQFCPGDAAPVDIHWCGQDFPFGADILFDCGGSCTFAVEVGSELTAPVPPSVGHALAGANLILNPAAESQTIGKTGYRRQLAEAHSARLACGYVYANAGLGESTQDLVFAGHCLIAENGNLLGESELFGDGWLVRDIDMDFLAHERRRNNAFRAAGDAHRVVRVALAGAEKAKLERFIDPMPFMPDDAAERERRCEEILKIQAYGLAKRIKHTWSRTAVIGLSGGLDSTLALVVAVKAFDLLGRDRKDIIAITMPCFGTTSRTRSNAEKLAEGYGTTLKTVNIAAAVKQHFEDIGQPMDKLDVTFENAQARERTQVLMDIANQCNGMVIGTGDLSELALGWATYNGDHMSMYSVNGSIPKTLVRHVVRYAADHCGDAELSKVLYDILNTPVSPELLPPKDGEISQKTESLVGPYELHDFFLYYAVRRAFTPKKIYRLAQYAFHGEYTDEVLLYWLKNFYRRFFIQQFKRSCLPDGPKVGNLSFSPRGDWRMPSDACFTLWMAELETL